jgi:MFS family permease
VRIVVSGTKQAGARLGLPALTGHRQLAAALFTDSLGDGLFVPFAVVYFLRTTALPLPVIGLGLTVSGLLALGASPICGILVDRLGTARVVIIGNLTCAVAFTGYLVVGRLWQLMLFAFLAAVGTQSFWTANLALVGEVFDGPERARWFAFQRAARNGGYGLGGLLAAAALGSGSGIGYRALDLANAATFVLAAALVISWAAARSRDSEQAGPGLRVRRRDDGHDRWRHRHAVTGTSRPQPGVGAKATGGYWTALTDWPFVLLAAMNFVFVLCMMVLDVLLTLYLVKVLHEPVWLSGVLFATSTAAVATLQTVVWAMFQHRRPVRVLQLSAAIWGLSFLVLMTLPAAPRWLAIAGAFIAIAVYTAALLIQGPVLNGLVVAAAPEPLRGRYMAVYQLSWALGRAASPGLFGWLFNANHALPWLTLAAACAACTALLATRLGDSIGSL